MLAYVSMGSAMAPILGPIIGGVVYAYIGWVANFYAVALGGILLLPLLMRFMPETNQHKNNSIKIKQVLSNYGSILKNIQYMTTVLSYGGLFFAGGVFLTGIAFIYSDIFQVKLEYIGLGISPMLLSYIIAASLAGKLEKKFGSDKAIMSVFYTLSIAMSAMLFLSYMRHPSLIYVVVPMIVYYFSLGLIGPMLNHLSLSFAPNEHKGSASAMLTFIMMLGSTLGSILMSILYDHSLKIFATIIAISIAFSFFAYLIFRAHLKKRRVLEKSFDMN
jgi:DHA1 family bicyclomycin/chloramphenicol resistance-like MFS transporter